MKQYKISQTLPLFAKFNFFVNENRWHCPQKIDNKLHCPIHSNFIWSEMFTIIAQEYVYFHFLHAILSIKLTTSLHHWGV